MRSKTMNGAPPVTVQNRKILNSYRCSTKYRQTGSIRAKNEVLSENGTVRRRETCCQSSRTVRRRT